MFLILQGCVRGLLNYIYYYIYFNIYNNIYNYVRDFRHITNCKCSCVAASLRHSVMGWIVVSMQAISENNVISGIKIFVEADCSNLGDDAKNWAKMRRNTGNRESTGNGESKEKSPILCKIFSRK